MKSVIIFTLLAAGYMATLIAIWALAIPLETHVIVLILGTALAGALLYMTLDDLADEIREYRKRKGLVTKRERRILEADEVLDKVLDPKIKS